jgi:hypothetical protein
LLLLCSKIESEAFPRLATVNLIIWRSKPHQHALHSLHSYKEYIPQAAYVNSFGHQQIQAPVNCHPFSLLGYLGGRGSQELAENPSPSPTSRKAYPATSWSSTHANLVGGLSLNCQGKWNEASPELFQTQTVGKSHWDPGLLTHSRMSKVCISWETMIRHKARNIYFSFSLLK